MGWYLGWRERLPGGFRIGWYRRLSRRHKAAGGGCCGLLLVLCCCLVALAALFGNRQTLRLTPTRTPVVEMTPAPAAAPPPSWVYYAGF